MTPLQVRLNLANKVDKQPQTYPTILDLIAVLTPHLSTSFVGNRLIIGPGDDGLVGCVGGATDELPTELKMIGFGFGFGEFVEPAGLFGVGLRGLNVG